MSLEVKDNLLKCRLTINISLPHTLSLSLYIYIYIEREREGERYNKVQGNYFIGRVICYFKSRIYSLWRLDDVIDLTQTKIDNNFNFLNHNYV